MDQSMSEQLTQIKFGHSGRPTSKLIGFVQLSCSIEQVLETLKKRPDTFKDSIAKYEAMLVQIDNCEYPAEFAPNSAPVTLMDQLPEEGTEEADRAIREMLKEREWPNSSMNAGRAGWRAARLFGSKRLEDKEG